MNIYMYLTKLFEIFNKNGWIIIVDIHNHSDNEDYAKKVTLLKTKKGVRKETSLSGGRNECVWNTYYSEYNDFISAFKSSININNVNELANAIFTSLSFEERWGRIGFEELCQIDKELSKYCNSRE